MGLIVLSFYQFIKYIIFLDLLLVTCAQVFNNIQILDRRKERFQCPRCLKEYSLKQSFNAHLKECGTQPKFKCCMCPYKSFRKGDYRLHLARKHNILPGDKDLKDLGI